MWVSETHCDGLGMLCDPSVGWLGIFQE